MGKRVGAWLVAVLTGLVIGGSLVASGVLARHLPCGLSEPSESRKEAAAGTLLGLLFALDPDPARYAPGYNEAAFRSLTLGLLEPEVMARVGSPLSTRVLPDKGRAWYYSGSGPGSQDYLTRVLIFDDRGVLTERHSDCYLD
jgi:hypothetical protein